MHSTSNIIATAIQVSEYPEGGFTLEIGGDAMLELLPTFEAEKSYSNGPAWAGLIEFIVSSDFRMADFEMAEGLWSSTREPLDRLRSILLEAAAEPSKLRKLIRDGRAAGFGHGFDWSGVRRSGTDSDQDMGNTVT